MGGGDPTRAGAINQQLGNQQFGELGEDVRVTAYQPGAGGIEGPNVTSTGAPMRPWYPGADPSGVYTAAISRSGSQFAPGSTVPVQMGPHGTYNFALTDVGGKVQPNQLDIATRGSTYAQGGFPFSPGVPYYGEGSDVSQALGPLAQEAWGGGGGANQLTGANIRDIISSDYSGRGLSASTGNPTMAAIQSALYGPTGGSGTGAPTQRAVGSIVGGASNLLFPGLGFITSPLARMITGAIQRGGSGGPGAPAQPAPAGGGPTHVGQSRGFDWSGLGSKGSGGWGQPMGYFGVPKAPNIGQFGAPGTEGGLGEGSRSGTLAGGGISYADILASGVTPRTFAPGQVGSSSVQAPGGLGGTYGQGSWGGGGSADLMGRLSTAAMRAGRSPALGLDEPGGALAQYSGALRGRAAVPSFATLAPYLPHPGGAPADDEIFKRLLAQRLAPGQAGIRKSAV
jgi:hypothetical protein